MRQTSACIEISPKDHEAHENLKKIKMMGELFAWNKNGHKLPPATDKMRSDCACAFIV